LQHTHRVKAIHADEPNRRFEISDGRFWVHVDAGCRIGAMEHGGCCPRDRAIRA
jgi:hypothetical protein